MKWFQVSLAVVVGLYVTVDARAQIKNADQLIAAFDKAEVFNLYSLDPNPARIKPKNPFHGWKVVGSTPVRDLETRRKLLGALAQGIKEGADSKPIDPFTPRHGIRVILDAKVWDLVLSFEGLQGEMYSGDRKVGSFPLTPGTQTVFDQLLKDEKVPLSPVAKTEEPLPGFPEIKYNADMLDVTVRGDRPLLAIAKTEYDKEKKEIVWLVEVQNDLTYEDFVAIRTLWENGTGSTTKPPVAHFFSKDNVALFTRELKEEGKLRNAKKGDCIRFILEVGEGFPDAASMEIRAP